MYSACFAKEKRWCAGLYIRLSKEDGESESLSVKNQRKILIDYFEKNFSGEDSVCGFYIDDGKSGTDVRRPEFTRLISDVTAGKINCVICKNLSRAFRNYADQGYYLESFFPNFGVRFISIGDPYMDTYLQPELCQGLEVPITGILNDRYALKTSNDVRRTFDIKRSKGEFIGAFAPFGYKKSQENKNKLVIDEEAAQIVRYIFTLFSAGGYTKTDIARKLNSEAVLSPTEYKMKKGEKYANPAFTGMGSGWSDVTVGRILQNPIYIGTLIQGKRRVVSYKVHKSVKVDPENWYVSENAAEPIVTAEQFEKVQEILKLRRKTGKRENKTHILSGFVFCGNCGKALTRKTAGGYSYLCCRKTEKSGCGRISIREDEAEKLVLTAISEAARRCDRNRLREMIENSGITAAKIPEEDTEKLKRALCEVYIDYKCGKISEEMYLAAQKRLSFRIEKSLNARTNYREPAAKVSDEAEYFIKTGNINYLNRGLVCCFISKIEVFENEVYVKSHMNAPSENVKKEGKIAKNEDILNN